MTRKTNMNLTIDNLSAWVASESAGNAGEFGMAVDVYNVLPMMEDVAVDAYYRLGEDAESSHHQVQVANEALPNLTANGDHEAVLIYRTEDAGGRSVRFEKLSINAAFVTANEQGELGFRFKVAEGGFVSALHRVETGQLSLEVQILRDVQGNGNGVELEWAALLISHEMSVELSRAVGQLARGEFSE